MVRYGQCVAPHRFAGYANLRKGLIAVCVKNQALIAEIRASKKRIRESNTPLTPAEAMNDKLAMMLMRMVNGLGSKRNWCGYTWLEDMKADAFVALCQNYCKFNENKTTNAFALSDADHPVQLHHLSGERDQAARRKGCALGVARAPAIVRSTERAG
jgi:hypothetical protein